jgi:signal transduction histidine kinase
LPRRMFFTPTRAVLGLVLLALLVVGGLAWVSVSALQAEADRRRANAANDHSTREHFALWRLDSHLLAPLGVENNRPVTNYAALAAPAPVVLDDSGLPTADPGRVPSPLLSAELPAWMLLHFEVDAARGWRSPQVLPPTLARTLAADPLNLPLTNCTPDRGHRLDDLRTRFPLTPTLAALAASDRRDRGDPPYFVPVPLADEPATDKPTPTPLDGVTRAVRSELAAARGFAYTAALPAKAEAKKAADSPAEPKPPPKPDDKVVDWKRLARGDDPEQAGHPLPANVQDVELSAEARARKDAFGQMRASRAGGYEPVVNTPLPSHGLKARAPGAAEPTGGVKPGPPADELKKLEDNYRNTAEWSERMAKTITDRSQRDAEKLRELADPQSKGKQSPQQQMRPDAVADKLRANTPRGLVTVKPGDPDDEAATPKSAPVVKPLAVRLSPLRAVWLTAADGTVYLLLVRTAAMPDGVVYQGVLLDWAALRPELTALVTDLFPQAELEPLGDGPSPDPESTLNTLPVRLVTHESTEPADPGFTTLRLGLAIAWAAAVLAIGAVAVGGRAALVTSERRMRFASAVTHELRTPLTALQLHLDLLTSGLISDEEKKAEYLATVAAETDRLNRLVENVLDFARLEKSSALALARPMAVSELLATLEHTWADRLRGEGFELVTESTTPDGQTVTVDRRVMEQVLGNLIDNARKYAKTAADRRIGVRATAAGTRVAIEVEDHGPGVPAGEEKGIFKPFRRGSTSTDTGGAGLGLALAKEWAELFGGSLTYHPTAGGGACFRLELPG